MNNTYHRNGRRTDQMNPPPAAPEQMEAQQQEEQKVAVDGFSQVLEMLKIADPQFRASLLRRLAARDRELAMNLMHQLEEYDSRA